MNNVLSTELGPTPSLEDVLKGALHPAAVVRPSQRIFWSHFHVFSFIGLTCDPQIDVYQIDNTEKSQHVRKHSSHPAKFRQDLLPN